MIRVDTWKTMMDSAIRRVWSNSYYLDSSHLAYMQSTYDGGFPMRNFVFYERNLHFDPVHYTHVTAFDITGDITNGQCLWPYEGTLRGFWNPWSGLCPWSYARRHVFSVSHGRPRQLWIRGGLQNADIELTPGGRLLLPALKGWDSNFQDAVAHWFVSYPRETFYVRHNTRTPGAEVYLNPLKWRVTGASDMHAAVRAEDRYAGGGGALYESAMSVTELAARFRSYSLTFNTPVPHRWYVHDYWNDLLTQLGTVISFTKSVGEYFSPPGGESNGGGNVARWAPLSDAIADTCQTLKAVFDAMKDGMSHVTWMPDGPYLYCSDDDWSVIWNCSRDICAKVAWMASLDYRTPINLAAP